MNAIDIAIIIIMVLLFAASIYVNFMLPKKIENYKLEKREKEKSAKQKVK